MTHLHWHLTDDEGWRLPSKAFPDLPRIGGKRGTQQLPPQYADGPGGQEGAYTREQVDAVVTRAAEYGITVMPEIDMPGHVTAMLAAVPGITDPDEPADSYRSIQGYPNNALNPGVERVYEVVETIIDELCEMFPSPVIHVGGDEVDHASWAKSPAAAELSNRERLNGTMELQAYFMRRVHQMLASRGRILGGWDECAEGGGVNAEGTLLFAWQKVETTASLIEQGYDVICTPGQAYYLDMVQAAGWNEIGAAWAGVSTPEGSYRFEPSEGLPDGPVRLVGVQTGIWCESINSVRRFNHMVFPRLSAVAEAGWTSPENKDWSRFAALSHLMPQL
jgi:hexosaminidase